MIQDEVRRFIVSCIPSVPYLEAMLLLHNEPQRQWTFGEVAQRLFINESRAENILQELVSGGVVRIVTQWPIIQYQFAPQNDELKTIIDQLILAYSTHLIEITNLIHSNIDQKAYKFANAFVWKKES